MKKPLNFSTYKILHKMSFNEFNRWLVSFYSNAFKDGVEEYAEKLQSGELELEGVSDTFVLEPEDCVSAISEDSLRELLMSVNGIGEKRADVIVSKILQKGVDKTLWD